MPIGHIKQLDLYQWVLIVIFIHLLYLPYCHTLSNVVQLSLNHIIHKKIIRSYIYYILVVSGTYSPLPGDAYVGGHAVKVLGWGNDEVDNTPYWLVANSWGSNWAGLGGRKI